MKAQESDFNKCCAKEIKRIWDQSGGSMNVVHYEGTCPVCGHYIGLTQTSQESAWDFLSSFGIISSCRDVFVKINNNDCRVFRINNNP